MPGAAALLAWLLLLILAAMPAQADCGRPGGTRLPALPVLTPAAGGTLSLTIRAERARGPVMIGDLPVADVPVFVVQSAAGTRLRAVDPLGEPGEDLPARCLTSPEALYAGSIWALNQGDRLHVGLSSALDFRAGELPVPPAGGMNCHGINLHTHGLLVSAERHVAPDGSQSIGDQAFDMALPSGDAPTDGDPCAPAGGKAGMAMQRRIVPGTLDYAIAIPGQPGRSGRASGEHPSGLFWFHPHVHGYSAALTAGGMAGLITIGAPRDYLCADAADGCAPLHGVPVRTLILKDAEIVPDGGGWRLAHERVYALEDACVQSPGRDDERRGECRDYRGRRWLFTINGARYPAIDDAVPGRAEIWRIVNASPNMSYRLRLRPRDGVADALPMQLLSFEGAAPAPEHELAPTAVNELLLMPASRAEIAVVPPATGGTYVLEQQAFTTSGDSWPRALLAEMRVPAGAAVATTQIRLRAAPSPPSPQPHHYGPTAEPACDYAAGSVRRILLVARPSFTNDRRRPARFGLIATLERPGGTAEMVDADGTPQPATPETWKALLARDADAPAFMHNPFGTICTYLGHSETWIIDNYTAEAHNFHIHQTEFRMADGLRTDPAFFSPTPANGVGALQQLSDRAIAASDADEGISDAMNLYRDTVSVPRGVSTGGRGCDGSPFADRCRPGRITLIVRFDRDAQIGTFVYHCHILQHEDAGMMAVIRVLCPPDDAACKARHPSAAAAASDHRMAADHMQPPS